MQNKDKTKNKKKYKYPQVFFMEERKKLNGLQLYLQYNIILLIIERIDIMTQTKKDFLFYKTASGEMRAQPVEVQRTEITKGYMGYLSLYDKSEDKNLGSVSYNIITRPNEQRILHFEGLISHVEGKGIGTKLILELIEISQELGGNGCLSASASPFTNQNAPEQLRRPLTNMEFYYKLGFTVDDKAKDQEIRELLEKGEHIPLRLNVFTNISLSKEAAERLQQKAQYLQQEFEKKSNNKLLNNFPVKFPSHRELQNN